MRKSTKLCKQINQELFTELQEEQIFVIDVIATKLQVRSEEVSLMLRKIRLNELGLNFRVANSTTSRILTKIASTLSKLIMWPQKQELRMHLHIPFCLNYSKVVAIIDCFEVEIERSSNPVHQILMWSEYYNCNTTKFFTRWTG